MKLPRTVAEILSSHSTVRRLLHPVVVLQSPLYSSLSSSSSSSNLKPKYTRKQIKSEPEISEPLQDDHHDLGLPFQLIIPQKTDISNRDWPKPSEIPWQAKVANSVNLIGSVAEPVQSGESPDGKFWAGTSLLQDKTHDSIPLSIPIIFEGYLAHVAACHLKEKDLVHVAGQLSGDPPQLAMARGFSSIQVKVDSINFVQGKKGYTPYKQDERASTLSVNTAKNRESVESSWRDLVDNPNKWSDYRNAKLNGLVKPKYPDFKHKDSGQPLWLDSAPKWVMSELQTTSELRITSEKEESSWSNSKRKSEESWKNLVENPDQWWDNRSDKVNPKYPDFRHKETREGLWLDSSPAWVLDKLPPAKPKVIATHKRDTLLS